MSALDYSLKAGDLLSDLEVRLEDRNGSNMDLTSATGVFVFVRAYGATTNAVGGEVCEVKNPRSAGLIVGPPVPLVLPGDYQAYFRVAFGASAKRVPSAGYLLVNVERGFE